MTKERAQVNEACGLVLFNALDFAHGQRGRNLQAEGDQPNWDVSASKEKAE